MNSAWALLCFAAALGLAQSQTPNLAVESRRLLGSRLWRERAWGAWYAGVSHDPSLGAILSEQLREAQPLSRSARDSAEYAYVQSLFDALIQLGTRVPTNVMLPFEDSWRTEILILWNARNPNDGPESIPRPDQDAESALLAMREHEMPDDQWAAVNDLLFAIDIKTTCKKALEEIRPKNEFYVAESPGFLADGGSAGTGISQRRFPQGFPPIGLYQIRSFLIPIGAQIFMTSPLPLDYVRIVVPTDGEAQWFDSKFYGIIPGHQIALARLLATFSGSKSGNETEIFHKWSPVRWTGTDATGAEIELLLDEQAAAIHAVLQEMARRHLIETSGIRIPIAVIVRDNRQNRTQPMPEIPAVRDVVFP